MREEGPDTKKRGTGRGEKGVTLLEMTVVVAILGCLAVIGVGAMDRVLEQSSARSLATTFLAIVNQAKTQAILDARYTGVVFRGSAGGVVAQVYRDGDRDGLSSDDIRRGVDKPLAPPTALKAGLAWVGLPEAVQTDPEGNHIEGDSGVRFGRGDILSFGPLGTATPGSLYVTCDGDEAWAFRVSGLNGRVRIFRWKSGIWTLIETN